MFQMLSNITSNITSGLTSSAPSSFTSQSNSISISQSGNIETPNNHILPVTYFGTTGTMNHPLARNLKFLFLNGIGYRPCDSQSAAEEMSRLLHGTEVEYAYVGISKKDVYNALTLNDRENQKFIRPLNRKIISIMGKIADNMCPMQQQQRLLDSDNDILSHQNSQEKSISSFSERRTWRSSNAHTNNTVTGRLVVVIHSGGAAIFRQALRHLPLHIAQRITAITLGGACQIGESRASQAFNIIHMTDLVPKISWLATKNPDIAPIQYIGSRWSRPMSGHAFLGHEHQEALKKILNVFLHSIDEIAVVQKTIEEKRGDNSHRLSEEEEASISSVMIVWKQAFPQPHKTQKTSSVQFEEVNPADL